MPKTSTLTFYGDDDGLSCIDKFASALKLFGIFVVDITKPTDDSVSIVLTDVKPEKEWGQT